MLAPSLRILVVGLNFAPETTGIAPYTTAMVQGLRERGHEVRVITSFPHYPSWRTDARSSDELDDVTGVAATRVRHYVPTRPTGLRRLAFEIAFGVKVAMCRGWGRPEVVLCVSPALFSTALAVLRARAGRRRPAVGLIVQDLYSKGVVETGAGGARTGRVMRAFESRVARAVDGVSVIHPRFRTSVVDGLGVPEQRVGVVRNWTHVTPAEAFDVRAFRDSIGWGRDECVVLHSGAMGLKQALENVVDAARLADNEQADVRFVLLGNGSQRDHLQRLAQGVASIQFLDSLDEVGYGRALRAADVLLVNERPGVSDMAVPSKLTTYFGAGRPVIAATELTSATAEEIVNSGAGAVVQPGSPQRLLDAVQAMAADEFSSRYGRAGQEYCSTVLSEHAAIGRYHEWVRVLHAEHRRKQG